MPDVVDYLEPAFAHHVSQLLKVMVDDPNETDARGFYVEAHELPGRIADPALADAISAAVRPHVHKDWLDWLGGSLVALSIGDPMKPILSNADEVCVPAHEAGIELFL